MKNLDFKNCPLILAPMAGVTDVGFRNIAKQKWQSNHQINNCTQNNRKNNVDNYAEIIATYKCVNRKKHHDCSNP